MICQDARYNLSSKNYLTTNLTVVYLGIMNGLTLKELKSILNKLRKQNKIQPKNNAGLELSRAIAYMQGSIKNEPRDPREVLAELGVNR